MFRFRAYCCCLLLANTLISQAAVVVYLDPQGSLFGLSRPECNDPVSALTALAAPPATNQAGEPLASGVLSGTKVLALQTEGDTAIVDFSQDIIGAGLDEARLSAIFEQVTATLRQFGLTGSLRLQAGGKLLSDYLSPLRPLPTNPSPKAAAPKAAGALSGKKIALSPGHGWFWNGSGWYTQRPVYCSPLNQEDFHNLEEMQYLNTYLTQDGATTKPHRCLDKSYGTDPTSGKAWWQVAAYVWLKNQGYPCSVYANSSGDCTLGSGSSESSDDIRARPLASDYDSTDIYVSLHSNGYTGDCTGSCPTGTETYYDSTGMQPTASHNLANAINPAIIAAITGNADSSWTCHGTCVKDSAGSYGEIRIPNRAATLTEIAFHDTCDRDADANHLRDNFFRSTFTWGMYKGICDYFGVTPGWAYYSDEIVSHDIPTGMNPGATATVHITFRNRGVLWNDTRGFQLGAVGDSDPFTATTRYNVGSEIGPNTTKTFTLTFTAPTTPGTYVTDWRMLRSGVTWFGATLSVSVNVGETGYPATWGPYNLTTSRCIYYPANNSTSLRTGWYTTTAGTGAARSILKAADSSMATMPDAAIVSGSTFTVAFTTAGTYSTTADNPLNIYRIGQTWDSSAVWNSPWAAGGNYSSLGTSSQSVVYPTDGTVFTFSVGAGYSFPYGVMMKGDAESSITYRKAWKSSSPSPTLSVSYTTPTPTIRSWAYLGWYDQGASTDRQLRIDTDQVAGTYGGVPVTETDVAPEVGGPSYGNSYGTRQWQQGAYTNDLVDLNSSYFYNAIHENAVTYCFVYVYNSKGSSIANAYLGIGSDDSCKVWWNGAVVGSDIVGRGVAADSDFWGPITINAGWNRLLLKVENGTSGHGLYARFANASRTNLTDKAYLSFYTTDSTPPGPPTSLTVPGVTSGLWQNTVAAPTFTWTSGADSQAGGEGVSGVRGQKYYFGPSSGTAPDAFQTATTYAPGAQADGEYYFKVDTVDGALNESSIASFAFLYDGTAPDPVTSFGSSSPGTSDTDWYNSAADLTWTWTAATDATSGLDGYAIAQDTSPATDPGTTKTHDALTTSYTLAGPQASGEYWLHVRSEDVAGNWLASGNASHRRVRIDRTSPAGVSLAFGTITPDSITVTAAATDAHSGISASTGYNYSRAGASDSGAKGDAHTWTGLIANTEYSGLLVTVSDQAVPAPNSAASSAQTQWTLSLPPASGSVTPDNPSPTYGSTNTWTTVGGFGAGTAQYYRYAFDLSPTHTWADSEPQWSSATLATVPTSSGTWYLHVKGYNGADVGNGSFDYSLAVNPKALTVTGIGAQNKVYDGTTNATLILDSAALVGVVNGDDVTLDATNAVGAFSDPNVGTGKTVTISGLALAGANAASYTLAAPSPAADITGAATTTLLVSSENPAAPGSNVTFTATMSSGVGAPTGDVVFLASAVPFSTNTLIGGVAAASTASLPPGTNTVAAQYAAQGNYLGSSATLEQVIQSLAPCSLTNAIVGITDNLDGTFTITFAGTPQAQYYVVASPDAALPTGWSPVPGSTNTVADANGLWSVTLTNAEPQRFYRSAAISPCP
jgi:N-acetylmuramoyl-L-alanine amidase